MFRSVLLFGSLLMAAACQASPSSETFREALEAARSNNWQQLESLQSQLGEDHPLQAYLDFHHLRRALPDLDPEEIHRYRERYPDSPLPNDITGLAQAAYGQAGRHQAMLAISPTPPAAIERRCYYYQALKQQDHQTAMAGAREIWLHGQSRPSSCDPLFDQARETGVINADLIWQRLLLAYDSNSTGLMGYLSRLLADSPYANASSSLLELHSQPSKVQSLPDRLSGYQREILLSAGLRRWAGRDPIAARQWFAEHSQKAGLSNSELRERAGERIAWFSTIRNIEENRPWLDQWLTENGSESLLQQRARRAVIEQDWPGVLSWYQRLPETEQNNARWLYWKARALDQRGDSEQANEVFRQAAQQRNFFAFMAADQLNQPYQLNDVPPASAPAQTPAAIERIRLLQQIDANGAAWREWRWLLSQQGQHGQQQLAQLALDRGWFDLAVEASIQSRSWNTLAWRFPPAYQQQFLASAREHKVDPWLAMAIARRESAFNPRAQSPAGALGVMQLMPGTARQMAREAGLPNPNQDALFDPQLNIALGSRYLAQVLSDFNNNRILALAAYNAGPNRVSRWLEEIDQALPVDVWIESIPFRETRDYVQAVLTYRALFLGLHTEAPMVAQLLSPGESNSRYSIALLKAPCDSRQDLVQQTC